MHLTCLPLLMLLRPRSSQYYNAGSLGEDVVLGLIPKSLLPSAPRFQHDRTVTARITRPFFWGIGIAVNG